MRTSEAPYAIDDPSNKSSKCAIDDAHRAAKAQSRSVEITNLILSTLTHNR